MTKFSRLSGIWVGDSPEAIKDVQAAYARLQKDPHTSMNVWNLIPLSKAVSDTAWIWNIYGERVDEEALLPMYVRYSDKECSPDFSISCLTHTSEISNARLAHINEIKPACAHWDMLSEICSYVDEVKPKCSYWEMRYSELKSVDGSEVFYATLPILKNYTNAICFYGEIVDDGYL